MAGQFVAVGNSRKRGLSSDGITWSTSVVGADLSTAPTGAAYSETQNLIVVGGPSGDLPQRSPGPTFATWTMAPPWPLSLSTRMIAYSPDLDLWIAGTENAEIGSSPDAINWTLEVSSMPGFVRAGTWSSDLGIFVAGSASTDAGSIRTSPDGTTWTTRTNPGMECNRVCWSPDLSLFVMTGRKFSPSTLPAVATSPTGVTWTIRTLPGTLTSSTRAWPVAWAPSLGLFAVGTLAGEIVTSSDGTTWTQQTSPFGSDPINSIAWSEPLGLFVAVGGAGKLATSSDGTTWTSRTSGFSTDNIAEVLWVDSGAGTGLVVGFMTLA